MQLSTVSNYGSFDQKSSVNLKEVIIDKSSKIDETALSLFGDSFQGLNEKLAYKETMMNRLSIVPYLSTLASASTLVSFTITLDFNLFLIFLASLSSYSLMIAKPLVDKHYGKKVNLFLESGCLITQFYNSFEDFKLEPNISKIQDLFSKFEKMRSNGWFNFIQQEKLLSEEKIEMFQSTGKLFLMDAVCSKIENSNHLIYAMNWKSTLETTLKLKRSDIDGGEPWKFFNIPNEGFESYLKFYLQRVNISSIEIAEKVKEYYITTLKVSLEKNLI